MNGEIIKRNTRPWATQPKVSPLSPIKPVIEIVLEELSKAKEDLTKVLDKPPKT